MYKKLITLAVFLFLFSAITITAFAIVSTGTNVTVTGRIENTSVHILSGRTTAEPGYKTGNLLTLYMHIDYSQNGVSKGTHSPTYTAANVARLDKTLGIASNSAMTGAQGIHSNKFASVTRTVRTRLYF